MSKKKILLFARDPGGANTIIPLVGTLQQRGYDVLLWGKDEALKRYAFFGLDGHDIAKLVRIISEETVYCFLKDLNPACVLTGTSADDYTEKYLWKATERLKIPSFAILDQWINYGVRFSAFGVADLKKYNEEKIHSYVPQKILVMDEHAKNMLVHDGLRQDQVVVTGQPYFDFLMSQQKKISMPVIQKMRNKITENLDDFIITYASEPLSKIYKETDMSEHYWGYTERTIFKHFLDVLPSIVDTYHKNIVVVVKLHPKENIDNYNDFLSFFKHDRITLMVDKNSSAWDLIISSDLICGMSSMLLLEAVLLQRPVVSMQIGLCRENPFILDTRGMVKSIQDRITLAKTLKSIIIDHEVPRYNFCAEGNSVERVIGEVERVLCQV